MGGNANPLGPFPLPTSYFLLGGEVGRRRWDVGRGELISTSPIGAKISHQAENHS